MKVGKLTPKKGVCGKCNYCCKVVANAKPINYICMAYKPNKHLTQEDVDNARKGCWFYEEGVMPVLDTTPDYVPPEQPKRSVNFDKDLFKTIFDL